MKFTATLQQSGKTATGIEVPPEVVATLDSGRRIPVVVTIGTHSYRTTIASMGGAFMIPVAATERAAAGIAAGDLLEVDVVVDDAPRTMAPPDDLAAVWTPDAKAFFESLPPGQQKAYVVWIESAKKAETRSRRVEEAAQLLAEHKRR